MPFPDEFTTFNFIDDCPDGVDIEKELEYIKLELDRITNDWDIEA